MAEPADWSRGLNAEAPSPVTERLETDLLREALARTYGFDVRRYTQPTLEAWATEIGHKAGTANIYALIERLVNDRAFGVHALDRLYYSDVQLFGDVPYWRALRDLVLPWLRTTPFLSIWMPECGHGAAVYSLAILLDEAGLTERTRIYATDADSGNIGRAAQALLSCSTLKIAQAAYERSGGTQVLERYFDIENDNARLQRRLHAQVLWSQFDPSEGESFNEFHFIDARFLSAEHSRHAFTLMIGSLPVSGLLALNPQYGRERIQRNFNYKEWKHGLYQRIA